MELMDKIRPEDFIETFEIIKEEIPLRKDCEPITIWISEEMKAKYDLIQLRSKLKFGKFIKWVIEKSIDKVAVEKKAS